MMAGKVDVKMHVVRNERRNARAVRPVLETDNPEVSKTLQRAGQAGLFPTGQGGKLADRRRLVLPDRIQDS